MAKLRRGQDGLGKKQSKRRGDLLGGGGNRKLRKNHASLTNQSLPQVAALKKSVLGGGDGAQGGGGEEFREVGVKTGGNSLTWAASAGGARWGEKPGGGKKKEKGWELKKTQKGSPQSWKTLRYQKWTLLRAVQKWFWLNGNGKSRPGEKKTLTKKSRLKEGRYVITR